jgi:hypothetical protein
MKKTTGYLILLTILMIPASYLYKTAGLLGLALAIGIVIGLTVSTVVAFNLIQGK